MEYMDNDFIINVILLSSGKPGKTTLIKRSCGIPLDNKLVDESLNKPFYLKEIQIDGNNLTLK